MAFGATSTAEEVTEGVNLSGKTAIVTGGNSGIGVETVRVLALRGAHVISACRNVASGEAVKDNILKTVPNANIEVRELDLTSKASVHKFAEAFKASNSPLHILINNAGVMATPFTLTGDGDELQFQTNHLSHFLLTNLLLDSLKKTAETSGTESRIVVLASNLHEKPYPEGIRFDRINDKKGYVPFLAYGQSKLANVLHARELSRRLEAEGAKVTVNAVHPGVIKTNLTRTAAPSWIAPIAIPIVFLGYKLQGMTKNVPQGAATSVYVATSPDVAGVTGKYFADCKVADGSAKSQDTTLATKLWDLSVQMTSA